MYSYSVICILETDFCWENLDIDQVNTIFQISEEVQTNGPLLPKYKSFEKKNFNAKSMANFGDSLKILLSQDL